MTAADLFYLFVGLSLLLAVVLPNVLQRHAVSAPIVLLLVGMLIGVLPVQTGVLTHPLARSPLLEDTLRTITSIRRIGQRQRSSRRTVLEEHDGIGERRHARIVRHHDDRRVLDTAGFVQRCQHLPAGA